MTAKRLLFMLGVILMIVGLFGITKTAVDRYSLDEVEAVVYDFEDSFPMAEYDYMGEHHMVRIHITNTVGLNQNEINDLIPGNHVTVLVAKDTGRSQQVDTAEIFSYAVIFLIPGMILVLIGLNSLKGFRREVIDRYRFAFIYTCIILAVCLCSFIYAIFIFKPDPDIMFDGLSEALLMFGLLIFSAATILIVWTVSLIVYYKKQKKALAQTNQE